MDISDAVSVMNYGVKIAEGTQRKFLKIKMSLKHI